MKQARIKTRKKRQKQNEDYTRMTYLLASKNQKKKNTSETK